MRIKGFSGLLFEILNQLNVQYQNPANQVNPDLILVPRLIIKQPFELQTFCSKIYK